MSQAQVLRDCILQLAMQGELTEQLSSDSSVEELFNLIQVKKFEGIKNKLIKKDNSCSIKKYDPFIDGVFEIPSTWRWVKLGEICQKIGAGSTPAGGSKVYISNGIKFLREQNVYNEGISYEGIVYISDEIHSSMDGSKVIAKDILLNITGASIGRNSLVPDEFDTANVNQHVLVIRLMDDRMRFYVHLCLQAPFIYNQMMAEQKGDKPGLSATRVSNFLLPLPPIEEQQRIVIRVNELLAKVDEFEKIETRLTVIKAKFPSDLRAAILRAALQGKLTEQLDTDSSVNDSVKIMEEERRIRIINKSFKVEKKIPEVECMEPRYDIPVNWVWLRLYDIGSWGSGATPPRGEPKYYINGTIPWIKTGELNNGVVNYSEEMITEAALSECSLKLNNIGDVMIAMYGATIGKLGIAGIRTTTNQACCVCSPFSQIDNRFLFYFLMSNKEEFIGKGAGSGQPNISKDKILRTLIPFPPVEEQRRIVERLDQLLPLCDKFAGT